jgi:hypothetical protein
MPRSAIPRVAALALLSAVALRADTLAVPSARYQRIQDAIRAASPGDIISVWRHDGHPVPDTYRENIPCQVGVTIVSRVFISQALRDSGYDSTWEQIHVEGVTPSPVVAFSGIADGPATLRGFTIQNGRSAMFGGGINCLTPNVQIIKNHIVGSRADSVSGEGGGIYVVANPPQFGNILIRNNLIERCRAAHGGGISIHPETCVKKPH